MKASNFSQIDLLRKRREENYFLEPYFIDNKKFIKRGIYIGLAIISVSLISGIFFIIRSSILESKKLEIKTFSDQYDALQIKLNNESKELKKVASFNRKLKNSIINISSSSALLTELSFLIPEDMRLQSFKVDGNNLNLISNSTNKKSLNLINGFLLNLDNSEFINFTDIDLTDIKIEKKDEKDKEVFVSNIQTRITTEYKNINEKYLEKLGSLGLLNRINILKRYEEKI